MIAAATPVFDTPEPDRRFTVTPAVEFGVLGVAAMTAIASYLIIDRRRNRKSCLPRR